MKKIIIILLASFFAMPAYADTTNKANYAWGTLSSAILDAYGNGDTFTVTLGTNAAAFPTGAMYVTVFASSCANPSVCATREIIKLSGRSGSTYTIDARNQESTTHSGDWDIGSKIQMPITAGIFDEYATLVDPTFSNDITVTGNATIGGTLTAKMKVTNYTTSQNPLTVASRTLVTNTGASGTLTHVLPACTGDGTVIGFWLTATQAIKIDPDGTDQIVRLTNAAGDSITSDTTVDTNITLMCIESGKWHAAEDGTWTDTD